MSTSNKKLLFTVAAISAILGTDNFQYRETRSGGVQCNLNLPNVKTGGAQNRVLYKAREALEAAGYVIEDTGVQLAIPPRPGSTDKRWSSWPCIYVNPPQTSGEGVTSVIDTIKVVKSVIGLDYEKAKNILTVLKNTAALELLESLKDVDEATREGILTAYATPSTETPAVPAEVEEKEPLI